MASTKNKKCGNIADPVKRRECMKGQGGQVEHKRRHKRRKMNPPVGAE